MKSKRIIAVCLIILFTMHTSGTIIADMDTIKRYVTLIGVNNSIYKEYYSVELLTNNDNCLLRMTDINEEDKTYTTNSKITEISRITTTDSGNAQLVLGTDDANNKYLCLFNLESKAFKWYDISHEIPETLVGWDRNLDFLLVDDKCFLAYVTFEEDEYRLKVECCADVASSFFSEMKIKPENRRKVYCIGMYDDNIIIYVGANGYALNVNTMEWADASEVFGCEIMRYLSDYIPDGIYAGGNYNIITYREKHNYGFIEKLMDDVKNTYEYKYVSCVLVVDTSGKVLSRSKVSTEYGNYITGVEFYEDSFSVYTLDETHINFIYHDVFFLEESVINVERSYIDVRLDYAGKEIETAKISDYESNDRLTYY